MLLSNHPPTRTTYYQCMLSSNHPPTRTTTTGSSQNLSDLATVVGHLIQGFRLVLCATVQVDPIVALKVLKRESTWKNKLYLKIGLHVRLRFYKLCCFTPKLDSFLRGTSRGSTPMIMDAVSVYWEIGKTD
ncbi:hypothetical protein Tco_0116262 [Tanacetum coccineum]